MVTILSLDICLEQNKMVKTYGNNHSSFIIQTHLQLQVFHILKILWIQNRRVDALNNMFEIGLGRHCKDLRLV